MEWHEGVAGVTVSTTRDLDVFATGFLDEFVHVVQALDVDEIEAVAGLLARVRPSGRLFVVGVGGSAANASHAVNDFRKMVGIEAYAPTDNVAELTARANDDGWEQTIVDWLRVSRLGPDDLLLVLSVGGGDVERNVSVNLVRAMELAVERGVAIAAIVGRDGGVARRLADASVLVPVAEAARITPHVEAVQSLLLHLLVTHPVVADGTPR